MKRVAVALAAILAVPLAGCSDDPQGKQYVDVDALTKDAGKQGVEWSCETREHTLVGDSAADCTDESGGRHLVAIFKDTDERTKRLEELRGTYAWHSQVPAMVLGKNWHVQCASEEACRGFADKMGGYFVTAPDYRSEEAAKELPNYGK
ncbi:hypothetical protein [Corynebacterium timonense]|uniref:Septum formation n=1 Tax=Corynebacterium timonense TaxID=441500 RepID=A0A1H1LRL2_9CORY|nr:hypothetical protein [Corynebacterium timonense]SDR76665.1 hypothetical protein SAMN04488539_0298 [Corynebacterium timonense]